MGSEENIRKKRKSRRDLSRLRPSRPSDLAPREGGTLPAPGGTPSDEISTPSVPEGSLAPPRTPTGEASDDRDSHAPPLAPARADEAEETQATFVELMQSASLLAELPSIGPITSDNDDDAILRRLDILEHYFDADGDAAASRQRRTTDGFFCFRESDTTSGHQIVHELAELFDVLKGVTLEHLGDDDTTLVLRHGEHLSAVIDERDEDPDTGEVDLRDLDAGPQTISVCSLVRALNSLVARSGGRRRLVPLRADGDREAYIAVPVTDALTLARESILEIEDPEGIMDFGAW